MGAAVGKGVHYDDDHRTNSAAIGGLLVQPLEMSIMCMSSLAQLHQAMLTSPRPEPPSSNNTSPDRHAEVYTMSRSSSITRHSQERVCPIY